MTDAVDAVLLDLDDTICAYEQSADEVLSLAFETVDVAPFFTGEEYVARFDEFIGRHVARGTAPSAIRES